MEFYLPGKWTWENSVMFECSRKGEYALLPHDFFYEIWVLSCSKFTVEIGSLAGRNKPAFACSVLEPTCVWQWVSLYYFVKGRLFP